MPCQFVVTAPEFGFLLQAGEFVCTEFIETSHRLGSEAVMQGRQRTIVAERQGPILLGAAARKPCQIAQECIENLLATG